MTARLASEKAWTATRRLKEVTSGELCFSSGRLLEDPMGELTLSIKANVKKKVWKKKLSVRMAPAKRHLERGDHTWEESPTLTSCNSAPRLALLGLLTAPMSSPCCVSLLSSMPSRGTSQPWRTAC